MDGSLLNILLSQYSTTKIIHARGRRKTPSQPFHTCQVISFKSWQAATKGCNYRAPMPFRPSTIPVYTRRKQMVNVTEVHDRALCSSAPSVPNPASVAWGTQSKASSASLFQLSADSARKPPYVGPLTNANGVASSAHGQHIGGSEACIEEV